MTALWACVIPIDTSLISAANLAVLSRSLNIEQYILRSSLLQPCLRKIGNVTVDANAERLCAQVETPNANG